MNRMDTAVVVYLLVANMSLLFNWRMIHMVWWLVARKGLVAKGVAKAMGRGTGSVGMTLGGRTGLVVTQTPRSVSAICEAAIVFFVP